MRGSFIFLGVSLCVLSGGSFEDSSFRRSHQDSFRCGNKISCEPICHFCHNDNYTRTQCYRDVIILCELEFKKEMNAMNSSSWCMWDKVKSHYDKLTTCTEDIADCLLLPWPNKLVEQMFVEMHNFYFQDCLTETLRDPPPNVVLALVMTPICLIPAMVVLVVLKTKNGDRRP